MAKGLIEFENQDKYFIKFFLLDATLNLEQMGCNRTQFKGRARYCHWKTFCANP